MTLAIQLVDTLPDLWPLRYYTSTTASSFGETLPRGRLRSLGPKCCSTIGTTPNTRRGRSAKAGVCESRHRGAGGRGGTGGIEEHAWRRLAHAVLIRAWGLWVSEQVGANRTVRHGLSSLATASEALERTTGGHPPVSTPYFLVDSALERLLTRPPVSACGHRLVCQIVCQRWPSQPHRKRSPTPTRDLTRLAEAHCILATDEQVLKGCGVPRMTEVAPQRRGGTERQKRWASRFVEATQWPPRS